MQGNDETHYYFYNARIGLKLNFQSILKISDGKKIFFEFFRMYLIVKQ
jgi:hypothetical protein